MHGVVFVAPFFLETTLRFVDAVASLPGVYLGLVSQDPAERLPPGLRAKLAAHWRIDDGVDPDQIRVGVDRVGARLGGVHRLLGTLEQLQVPLAEVRERLGIEGMGVEAARNFRDKARMKSVLREHGLPCARHRLVGSASEAREFAGEVGFPIVVKPPAGAAAKDTFRVDDKDALGQCLARFPSGPVLLEEFITGEEHSFDCVTVRGRPVWHSMTRYLPACLDVMRNPWIQWCVLLPREIDDPRYGAIRDAAPRALAALGIGTGLSHMEWFRRADGSVAISEVGARPPGAQFTTLISYAHEIDLYRAWARLVVFETFDPPPRHFAAGIAFLRGQGRGRVFAIHGLDQAHREIGPLIVEAKLPTIGQTPGGGYEGEGYVVLRHPDTGAVERALGRLVDLVRVELRES